MPHSIEELSSQVLSLPEGERVELAHRLLVSLHPEEENVEEAWAKEIDRRVSEVHQGKARGRPAKEVFSALRSRLLG